METIDLSGTLGLIATVVLTVNVLLGMLLSTAYKTKKWWQQLPPVIRKLNINAIHNYTAYIVADKSCWGLIQYKGIFTGGIE